MFGSYTEVALILTDLWCSPFPAEVFLCQAEINVSLERGGCIESCRLQSEPFPLQQESQELVDKAVFCDTTEILVWGGLILVLESQVLLKCVINTLT